MVSKLTKVKQKRETKPRFISWFLELVRELFPVLLVTYLALMLLETVFERSVSSYLNLDQLLIAVIVVGVGAVLTAPSSTERVKGERLTAKSVLMLIGTGLGGAAIVWYKTKEIGWLSYVISAVSACLIMLLSILIWQGYEGAEQKSDRKAVILAEEVMKRAIREAKETFKRTKREAKETKHRAIREAKEAMERAKRGAKERDELQSNQDS